MSIIKIKLASLKNDKHTEFHENVKITVEKVGAERLDIEALYLLYCKAHENELEALNFVRKSERTVQILEQDKIRDSVFRGLTNTIKGARDHFAPEERVAANKLWSVLLRYGNIINKPLDAQTATVEDILREFQKPQFAAAIDLLQLRAWTDKLTEENTKFRNLMTDRYNESTEKTSFRMKTARVEIDKYYKGIVKRLESQILSNHNLPSEFDDFITELNAVIKRYKDILAQEFGRKNAAAAKKESGECL